MKEIITDEDLLTIKDPALAALLSARSIEASEYVDHFSELVRFILVDSRDTISDVEGVVGLDLESIDGRADVFEEHPRYFELVYVLSDDGSGVTLFVNKEDISEDFARLCESYRAREDES
jgi:hypothetical protein